MSKIPFDQSVTRALAHDPRYSADAYEFLRASLDFTMQQLKKARSKESGHVSGRELCLGVREYAIQQFGPMVPTIFEAWGIHTTRDIGEMVFNLIDVGYFSKSETDTREDFDAIYDFHEAFEKPFLPARGVRPGNSPDKKKTR